MRVLQKFVLPGKESQAPDEMYVRIASAGAALDRADTRIHFSQGDCFSFDTYFNGFTVDTWKKLSQINTLNLVLKGKGTILVKLALHNPDGTTRPLHEQQVVLADPSSPVELPVHAWPDLAQGMLFASIQALTDGQITDGGWVTEDELSQDVRLALVITHFNRQAYVLPALQRIQSGLLQEPDMKIKVLVIDNSNNLAAPSLPDVTVIPNRNLGGSGGFTRGLMEASDLGFSHCLFMDDDASCELESIRRAYTLLSYGQPDKLAIAGSLLREVEPQRLFEKGAKFDGLCRPLHNGLDMTLVRDLLTAESASAPPDYGGWWFFAFQISQVDHYPFPFFVRGDDSLFSLMNHFNIVTMNGIGCWCSDFGLKNGPLTTYLDSRYHLLHLITQLNAGAGATLLLATRFFMRWAMSYHYASARAVTEAVIDVCKGKYFWEHNLDMQEVRKRIATLTPNEKVVSTDLTLFSIAADMTPKSTWRKALSLITLNGFLLPGWLIRNDLILLQKSLKLPFYKIFRHRRILYYYEPLQQGYIAQYDRTRFFRELLYFIRKLAVLALRFRALRIDSKAAVRDLTTRNFWDRVYQDRHNSVSNDTVGTK